MFKYRVSDEVRTGALERHLNESYPAEIACLISTLKVA